MESQALEEKLRRDEQRLRTYQSVFSTTEGRWVLMDLMREGGLLSFFDTNDPIQLSMRSGKRAMAIYIAESLALTFDQVIRSYTEIDDFHS